jgi:anaerobic ribonucleoside-triphosphate reductase activating protein
VPETHNVSNGQAVLIDDIISELDAQRDDHDGITVLGGEPFDQARGLKNLVRHLKAKKYHVTVYTGYTLKDLLARNENDVLQVLENIDLLIDGPFKRELAHNAGEYRGSSNQRLIYQPTLIREVKQ